MSPDVSVPAHKIMATLTQYSLDSRRFRVLGHNNSKSRGDTLITLFNFGSAAPVS